MGWKIFVHSVRMVLGNFRQAMQIAVGPALIATGVSLVLVFALGFQAPVFDEASGTVTRAFTPLFVFMIFAIFLIAMLWIAVSWHRFILLEDYPQGLLPSFRGDRMLAYLGKILLLALGTGVFIFVVGFVLQGLLAGSGLLGLMFLAAALLFVAVWIYRLSIILPATAVGRPLSISEVLHVTEGQGWTFFSLIVVTALFQFFVQVVFGLLVIIPVLGVVLMIFAAFLILPLINLSILTTLYGVYVEKRDLA